MDYFSIFGSLVFHPKTNGTHHSSNSFWTGYYRQLALDLGFGELGDGAKLREYVKSEYDDSINKSNQRNPVELINTIVNEDLTDNSDHSKVRILELVNGKSLVPYADFNLKTRREFIDRYHRITNPS